MSGNSKRNSVSRSLAARLMDFRMVAITAGTASLANMLVPGLGSSAVGAILGAAFALHVLKSPDV
jgi:hypothetical protein